MQGRGRLICTQGSVAIWLQDASCWAAGCQLADSWRAACQLAGHGPRPLPRGGCQLVVPAGCRRGRRWAGWTAVQHSHADCSAARLSARVDDAHLGAAELELGSRHRLGQGVGDHEVGGDVGESNILEGHALASKVVDHIDVLGAH